MKKFLVIAVMLGFAAGVGAAEKPDIDRITKETLIGTWIADEDNPDLRTSYTFNPNGTGLRSFFDGDFDITEYSVSFDGKDTILTYTDIAAEGWDNLRDTPLTHWYNLEYISNDEILINGNNYKRKNANDELNPAGGEAGAKTNFMQNREQECLAYMRKDPHLKERLEMRNVSDKHDEAVRKFCECYVEKQWSEGVVSEHEHYDNEGDFFMFYDYCLIQLGLME